MTDINPFSPKMTVDIGGKRLEIIDCISEREWSSVWQVRDVRLDAVRALKAVVLPYDQRNEESYRQLNDNVERDFKIHKEFSGGTTSVVILYDRVEGVIEIEHRKYVVSGVLMEWSDFGDVTTYLNRRQSDLWENSRELRSFLRQIALGVGAGHKHDIIHGDIKAANVLVFNVNGKPTPKLMDFGSAFRFEDGHPNPQATLAYMAPKLLGPDAQKQNKSTDIFALGVLFYEIVAGTRPHSVADLPDEPEQAKQELARRISKIDFSPIEKIGQGDALSRLLKLMLSDQETRIEYDIERVIESLEGQDEASVVRRATADTSTTIVTPDHFRWNPKVHDVLGHSLYYALLRGKDPTKDPAGIKEEFARSNIVGYSLYRLLGADDYLVRVWFCRGEKSRLEACLQKIHDTINGKKTTEPPIAFVVNRHYLLHGTITRNLPDTFNNLEPGHPESKAALLSELARICADGDLLGLTKSKFVVGKPLTKDRTGVRFFVGLQPSPHFSSPHAEGWCNTIKRLLAGDELPRDSKPKEVSVYVGEGRWQILLKFRLRHFHSYRTVWSKLIEELKAEKKDSIDVTTHVELDLDSLAESDDGPICIELTKQADSEGARKVRR